MDRSSPVPVLFQSVLARSRISEDRLGWSYYGENCIRYLFNNSAVRYYRILWIIVIFIGAIATESAIWTIADILNAAMCIPNVIVVLLLREEISKDTKYYLWDDHIEEEDPDLE